MATVSATQGSDYVQQMRDDERLRAAREAQQRTQEQRAAETAQAPAAPEARNPNLGNQVDMTA